MFMFKGSSETFFSHLLSGLAVDCLSNGGSQPKTHPRWQRTQLDGKLP